MTSERKGRRSAWFSQGYQWACIAGGDPGGCAESGGGFEARPLEDVEAEAGAHSRATGHPVQVDEMRSKRWTE